MGKSPRLNKCPVYDTKQSLMVRLVLRNVVYPFIAIAPGSTLAQSGNS